MKTINIFIAGAVDLAAQRIKCFILTYTAGVYQ